MKRSAQRTPLIKIKNKPIVNQDPTQVELTQLRAQLAQYRSAGSGSGTANSVELEDTKRKLQLSEGENFKLTLDLQSAREENTNMSEKALLDEAANQQMKRRLEELQVRIKLVSLVIHDSLLKCVILTGSS